MPYRLLIGSLDDPDFEFGADVYKNGSISIATAVDLVGVELSIDEMSAIVSYESNAPVIFAPADYDGIMSIDGYLFCGADLTPDLRDVRYGTPVWLMDGDRVLTKMFFKNAVRTAVDAYRINAMSAVGLLDTVQHLGGVYSGITFAALVAEITGGAIDYTIDQDVATVLVYGWLPIDTARNNLHQLMFAENVCLTKDSNGGIVFSFLYSSDDVPVIPSDRVYTGGNVTYPALASAVQITEHAFMSFQDDETVNLFDNTGDEAANNLMVTFSDPVHDLTAVGLTVVQSGANYAIVSGLGTLTGKKYTHMTQIVRKDVEGYSGSEKIVDISDATLVTLRNSLNVLDRCYAYYSERNVVNLGIVVEGERSGRQIAFIDPHGEEATGFIERMNMVLSTIIRGDAEVVTNFKPTGQGNNYSNCVILTGSGSWTVPDGITRCRATLIGGGHGGQSGEAGDNGAPQGIGIGGAGGAGGGAAKSITLTLENLVPGDAIQYSCGAGGASDADGGDTVFGSVSSASGVVVADGVINMFTGDVYALPGEDGVRGGNGADSDYRPLVTYKGQYWIAGPAGYGATALLNHATGGYGGGAAVGYDGGAGFDASVPTDYPYPGPGGYGATPIAGEDATTYGSGGNGGHGGGGGGKGGTNTPVPRTARGGYPGQGSPGGHGGNGCVIVYY